MSKLIYDNYKILHPQKTTFIILQPWRILHAALVQFVSHFEICRVSKPYLDWLWWLVQSLQTPPIYTSIQRKPIAYALKWKITSRLCIQIHDQYWAALRSDWKRSISDNLGMREIQRLHLGKNILIETDHKPLIPLFGSKNLDEHPPGFKDLGCDWWNIRLTFVIYQERSWSQQKPVQEHH